MFTRQQIKEAAKLNMNKSMSRSVGAVFLAALPATILSMLNQTAQMGSVFKSIFNGTMDFETGMYEQSPISEGMSAFFGLLSLLLTIFVTNVTTVGVSAYFLKLRGNLTPAATEPYAPYSEGTAGNIIKVSLTTLLLIVFGSLLIVPGIIFAFRYAMVNQVLALNPTISGKRARELSAQLMKDHWGEYFVLCLSFIGWFIVGGMTMGLLLIFYVSPYWYATLAEFFSCRRAELIGRGEIAPEELPSFGSDWYSPYNPNGPFQSTAPNFGANAWNPAAGFGASGFQPQNNGINFNGNPNDYMGFAGGAPVQRPPEAPENTPPPENPPVS